MAFTDNCDLYAAVSEDGINLVAKHVMTQRPSLFNYATKYIFDHQELACQPVPHTIDVTNHSNPLFSVVPPIPIFGADSPPVGLNFCIQLVEAEVDFYPGNLIHLPPELNPPLAQQHLALKVRVCGGLDCPSSELIDSIPISLPPTASSDQKQPPPEQVVPPTRKLQCFCLDAFVVAHVAVQNVFGKPTLVGRIDGVHVTGIKPEGLSANIDCYLRTTFAVLLKEKLAFPVSKMLFDISLLNLANITATLTPNPPIPNNPAIEDDQLKVFMNLLIQPPGGGGGGGGGDPRLPEYGQCRL